MLAVIAVKIKTFWQKIIPNRKYFGLVSFIIVAGVILSMWFAGTLPAAATTLAEDLVAGVSNMILTVAGWFIQMAIFLLKFVITLGGYNGFIKSQAVNVGWTMVRDMTNMFFVVVLLVIAFATILGIEDYSWKKLLSKLIFAAVLVNFSRQIAGIIIDLAQVIMITFINGIAATAGGNLINMFNVQGMLSLTANPSTNFKSDMFLAALGGLVFAAIMMVTIGVFAIMLLARMVTLWVLIVLSPLAFVLNVLPKTKTYADRWWKMFGENVVSGPIIAFFLWLSFVTLGTGQVASEITGNNALPANSTYTPESTAGGGAQTSGPSKGMQWDSLANFAIAVGMLMVGAKMAQELGVYGGSMMQKGIDFGKKALMVASGASAARWAYQKGLKPAAARAGKFALMNAPVVGGQKWIDRKNIVAGKYYDWAAKRTQKASDVAAALKVNEKGEYVDKDGNVQKGVGAWAKRLTARARLSTGIGYGGFRKAKSDDIAETTKAKFEQIDHLASTSSLKTGLEKQKSQEWVKFLQESGLDIKSGKMARMGERREEILAALENKENLSDEDVNKKLSDMGLDAREIEMAKGGKKRLDNSVTQKAKAGATQDLLAAQKAQREAVAKEKEAAKEREEEERGKISKSIKTSELKASTKQIEEGLNAGKELGELKAIRKLLSGEGKEKQKGIYDNLARIESEKYQSDLEKNKTLHTQRAEFLESDAGGHNLLQAALARQQASSYELNKMKEAFKTGELGANERAVLARQITSEIVAANGEPESAEKQQKLSRLTKQKDALHDLNMSLGAYDSQKEEAAELAEIGWTQPITDDNVAERWISRRIGRAVTGERGNTLQDALDEYKRRIGNEDEYKVRMRQFGSHAKNQMAQDNASTFIFEEVPDEKIDPTTGARKATGLLNYRLKHMSKADSLGLRRGWLESGDIDTRKRKQASGQRALKADGSGTVLVEIDDEQAQYNADCVGAFTAQSVAAMGKRGDVGDLNEIADKESLKRQLQALVKKASDQRAFEALTKVLDAAIKRTGITEEDLNGMKATLPGGPGRGGRRP